MKGKFGFDPQTKRNFIQSGYTRIDRSGYTALGMTATIERARRFADKSGAGVIDLSPDARTLSIKGTLDPLGAQWFTISDPKPCQCCGARSGKVVLSKSGRSRLERARRRKERRTEYKLLLGDQHVHRSQAFRLQPQK